jgi:hypothetical protein
MMQAIITQLVRLSMILGGIFCVILAAHGLCVYFSDIDTLYGDRNPADLFLVVNIPGWLDGVIEWASAQGFESWYTPVILLIVGVFVIHLQGFVSEPTRRWL